MGASMRLSGRPGTWVDIEWQADTHSIFLAFKGPSIAALDKERGPGSFRMVQPPFISDIPSAGLAPPQVEARLLWYFQALLEHSGEIAGLQGAILQTTGGSMPRRVVCTGYCTGGALAGIAAVWAGHNWPDSDVRCITFGAPQMANAEFAEIFLWITGSAYAVVHDGDAVLSSAMFQRRGLVCLGNLIHLSDTHCASAKVPGVDAHGYNHNLQVYKRAVENPSQGNIMRIPMNSRELHGLVSGRHKEELHAGWESSRMRAESEQGFSKESRLLRNISHHVCNMARLKIPDGANGVDVGDGSAEHSGDSAYERPQRGSEESHSSRLFREGRVAPDAQDVRACKGDFRKMFLERRLKGAALASHAVYSDEDYFRSVTGLPFTKWIHCKRTETTCALGWVPSGTLVIAWRGTANFRNVLTDIKFFSRKVDFLPDVFPGAKGHSGFLEQLSSVTDPEAATSEYNLVENIHRLTDGRQPTRVLCCGHSLGAAVAVLSAMWATVNYPDADVRCIGFASPRVGNKAFCKSANYLIGSSIRVEVGHDPIPNVPGRSMGYDEYDYAVILHQGRLLSGRRPVVCRMQLERVLPGRSGLAIWDDPQLRPQQQPTALFQSSGVRCIC
ncbi:g5320 [Coccomyxa viridis]|uniref:G5320 protein n=1 Tax=Coccomyxa viridis TaxID=1274662 RepID=A0ABP1FV35_9CHLO